MNSDDKKAEKALKKAQKLAKLEAKKNITVSVSRKEKKQPTGGYNPSEVESKWSEYWTKNKSFEPQERELKFSMVIPPPNITGTLHIGHAMMVAIEDCIVRYKRLNNYETVFIPGLDHAGIATQSVVMKKMQKENTAITRESFLDSAHEWSKKYSHHITSQLDRLGTSLDYSRFMFTMDEKVNYAVNKAFVDLYKKGLIYRDSKIVQWCGKLKTALSDLEVNYKNIPGNTTIEVDGRKYKFGILYHIKYYLTSSSKMNITHEDLSSLPYIVIATSRPETILGDSAICINPEDTRFEDIQNKSGDLSGNLFQCATELNTEKITDALADIKIEKKNKYKVNQSSNDLLVERAPFFAINPLTLEILPAIIDTQADLNFGTGVLKVTPAHDPVDFKLGKKHNLEFKKVIDENNKIVHEMYNGEMRFEARLKIVADLKKNNMFVKEEPYEQILPLCSRSGDIIEPTIKEQWWCDCRGMAKKALEAVASGEIELYPEEAKSIWSRWLENIKDWCLSRQLWWGHRIPAYRAWNNNEEHEWIIAETKDLAFEEARKRGYTNIQQDDDVLDTWFSSGLWPFSTLGWPTPNSDFSKYFPNSLLETGNDILFFWVARMVMLSYELTGSKPFNRIFLHGIVRDAHGVKMSKSVGNVIDPLYVIDGITLQEMTENLSKGNIDKRELSRAMDAMKKDYPHGIGKCGADALRFALLSYTNGMKDVNLDVLRVQGYSRFCNKIWNANKFILGILESTGIKLSDLNMNEFYNDVISVRNNLTSLSSHQKWIIQRLNETIVSQHKFIDLYNFMASSQAVYQLFFDFCDVVIELSKPKDGSFNFYDAPESSNQQMFVTAIFIDILKILNPYMPFITEEIHSNFSNLLINDYPEIINIDTNNIFSDVLAVSKIARSNISVYIKNSPYSEYFRVLAKDKVIITEEISDDFIQIGEFYYKIIEASAEIDSN